MKETAVFVCSHVFDNTKPVKLVLRSEGDLQMLCGGSHGNDEVPHLVGVEHLLARDWSLSEVVDIPEGWEAERTEVGDAWRRAAIDED